jgi:L-seryl-tRNA(Ser) seleniumtransferase
VRILRVMAAVLSDTQRALLRELPPIDQILAHSSWSKLVHVPPDVRRDACRAVVDCLRAGILAGNPVSVEFESVAKKCTAHAVEIVRPVLRRVVNGTGVVLHTNLGRAPLSEAALEAIGSSAGGYLNLEMDLDAGQRDNRMDRLGLAFSRVLGCGDVVVANNNAAAVFLALSALAGDRKKVVISRGELVEIGGSFRMPDIMDASGAEMVEVGTTNRTHLKDYEEAFKGGARLAMKVHRSNFSVLGFTKEVSVGELASCARSHDALVMHDLGSGLLRSAKHLGDDCVTASLAAGADLVLFSGDKLLGGPQAGIIAGKREVIAQIRSHPVMRLVRPGKLTMLALEATLLAWERDPKGGEIPCARLAAASREDLKPRAEALAQRLSSVAQGRAEIQVTETQATTGGGSAEDIRLDSVAVAIRPAPGEGSEAALAAALRQGEPCVVGRLEDGQLLLDVRTIFPKDEASIEQAFRRWTER